MKKYWLILPLLALTLSGYAQQSNKSKSKDRYREKDPVDQTDVRAAADRLVPLRALAESELPQVVGTLSEAIRQNGALPGVSSKYFAYSLLAGHETTARFQTKVSSLQGALRGMPPTNSFVKTDEVFHPFAALYAVLETGRNFFPADNSLAGKQAALEQAFRDKGLDEQILVQSKVAAQDISRSILQYAATDGFQRMATRMRQGTAINPEALQNAETTANPYRPFFIENAQMFALPAPAPFDTSSGSAFMAVVREVYDNGRNQTAEQRDAAQFWDAGTTTLSGHWLSICSAACAEKKVPFNQALRAHAITALAVADAYYLCWEEQMRYRRVQPKTVINRTMDAAWQPTLAGSATMEYASDYSLASAAAAEVLAKLLGDQTAFSDPTGSQARRFSSFRQAAQEASISRLYGGVQYRDALDAGLVSGRKLGEFVVRRLPVDQ
jgi:hypothetical protein